MNLNLISIPDEGDGESQQDFSTETELTRVIFKNLASEVIRQINNHEAMVGCVAWLTEGNILAALANRPSLIIVQKEDFLRPDGPFDKEHLRRSYKNIPALDRSQVDGLRLSYGGDPGSEAVRCVGVRPSRQTTNARMHHKFAVFGKLVDGAFVPQTVLTGSFNWTYNAGNSFENLLVLSEPSIVNAYFDEFRQVLSFSEPLDWTEEYVAPEWRIGS